MKKPDYEWWVENADTDSSLLLLMEDPDEFKRRVLCRAEQVGRTDHVSLLNHCKWRAIYEGNRFGAMSSILEDITAAPEPVEGRPFQGNLEINNKVMRDGAGAFPALGVSCFWVPWAVRTDLRRLDRLSEWALGCGMTYVRWFGSHDWEGGTLPSQQNYMKLLEHSIEELQIRGLRSQITMFTRRSIVDNPTDLIKQLADVVNRHREAVCLVELCNEFNHTHNGWSESELRALATEFSVKSDVPMALSAPAAETWDESKDITAELFKDGVTADALPFHFPRKQDTDEGPWRWVRQPWHSRHHLSGCPNFVSDNEHQRWDKSNGGRVVEVAAAAPLVAFVCGCGMTAHHDSYGVHSDRGDYGVTAEDKQLQKVWSAVMPLLPSDLADWEQSRVDPDGGTHPFPALINEHWTFEPHPSQGVSRAFAALRGKRWVMILTGVRGHVNLSDKQSVSYVVVSLKTGNEIYRGFGPCRLNESDGKAFFVTTE